MFHNTERNNNLSIKIGGFYSFFEDGEWGKAIEFTGFTKTNMGSWAHFINENGKPFCIHGKQFASLAKWRLVRRDR